MDKNPFFSIIIPTYNRANNIKHTLDSINKQSFRDFDVIVCDDGSTDYTKQVVDTFLDKFSIKYIWQENWGGPARPRNNGLKIARGEYIAFLDADDWWYPDKLEVVKSYLHDADIVYHDLDIYTEKGKRFFKKFKGRYLTKPAFIDLMKNENALIISSVAVRKNIINRAGGFAEEKSLISLEDFDLWLKISRITEKFTYIPKSLGAYLMRDSNISKASEKQLNRIKAVYDRHFKFLTHEDEQQARMLMSYLLGRTKQKIGLLKEALELFKTSSRSNNTKIKIRSICWVIYLNIIVKLTKRVGNIV